MRADILLLLIGISSGYVTNPLERRQLGGAGDLFSGIASIVTNSIQLGTGLLGAFSKIQGAQKSDAEPAPSPSYSPPPRTNGGYNNLNAGSGNKPLRESNYSNESGNDLESKSTEELKELLAKSVDILKKYRNTSNNSPKDPNIAKLETMAKQIIMILNKRSGSGGPPY